MIGIILIIVIQSILLIKSYFGCNLNQKTLNSASNATFQISLFK
jgi:hypothetical protein